MAGILFSRPLQLLVVVAVLSKVVTALVWRVAPVAVQLLAAITVQGREALELRAKVSEVVINLL
jgi:hypothetical protein